MTKKKSQEHRALLRASVCFVRIPCAGSITVYLMLDVSFYNSECTDIPTDIKQFQGLHQKDCLLQK